MSDPLAAMVKAVVETLSGDAAVQALCGDPVRVWDVAPKGGRGAASGDRGRALA